MIFLRRSTDQVSTWRQERYDPAYICCSISTQFVYGRKTGVPERPRPGRGTMRPRYGTSREIRDGWQPYRHPAFQIYTAISSHALPASRAVTQGFGRRIHHLIGVRTRLEAYSSQAALWKIQRLYVTSAPGRRRPSETGARARRPLRIYGIRHWEDRMSDRRCRCINPIDRKLSNYSVLATFYHRPMIPHRHALKTSIDSTVNPFTADRVK